MVCKGVCVRHKALKPVGIGRYSTGQKRCQMCETFLKWDGLTCPCCGYKLRTTPSNLKYKARLRAAEDIQEYKLTLQQRQKMHQQRFWTAPMSRVLRFDDQYRFLSLLSSFSGK